MSAPDESSAIIATQLQQINAQVAMLQRQVEALTAQHDLIEALVDEGLALSSAESQPLDIAPSPPSLRFTELHEFVDEFVRRFWEQPVVQQSESRWRNCWPEHPQVSWAMEFLWSSYEENLLADLESGGGSNLTNWTVGNFIPMMQWITSPGGPFEYCGHETHQAPALLGAVSRSSSAPAA